MGKSRPSGPYQLTEAEIPVSGDPFWPRLAEKVMPCLLTDRHNSDTLVEMFPEFSYSVAANLLYWLENNGLAKTEREGKVVFWRGRRLQDLVAPDAVCPACGGSWYVSLAGVVCYKCGRSRFYTWESS